MADRDAALFEGLCRQIGRLGADLREMATLRWQLAQLEGKSAVREIRRLVFRLAIAAVMTLVSLPLLAVAAAKLLAGWTGTAESVWLLIVAGVLLGGGMAGGYLAWRWFRARFAGIRQSLQQCREDLLWLRETFHSVPGE